jgi:hypothetical protein
MLEVSPEHPFKLTIASALRASRSAATVTRIGSGTRGQTDCTEGEHHDQYELDDLLHVFLLEPFRITT